MFDVFGSNSAEIAKSVKSILDPKITKGNSNKSNREEHLTAFWKAEPDQKQIKALGEKIQQITDTDHQLELIIAFGTTKAEYNKQKAKQAKDPDYNISKAISESPLGFLYILGPDIALKTLRAFWRKVTGTGNIDLKEGFQDTMKKSGKNLKEGVYKNGFKHILGVSTVETVFKFIVKGASSFAEGWDKSTNIFGK